MRRPPLHPYSFPAGQDSCEKHIIQSSRLQSEGRLTRACDAAQSIRWWCGWSCCRVWPRFWGEPSEMYLTKSNSSILVKCPWTEACSQHIYSIFRGNISARSPRLSCVLCLLYSACYLLHAWNYKVSINDSNLVGHLNKISNSSGAISLDTEENVKRRHEEFAIGDQALDLLNITNLKLERRRCST